MTITPASSNGYISRGNMTIVMSAAGLVMLAFGSFMTLQNAATDRRITDLQAELAKSEINFLRKEEHVEFKLRIDRDIALIRDEQMRRSSQIVPRTEHEARWIATNKDLTVLSDRLNQLRTETGSFVTVRDEIGRLHTQIDDMRKQINDRPAAK